MAEINNQDRDTFAEAHRLLGLDLTLSEQKRIAGLADELRRILEAAKARMRPNDSCDRSRVLQQQASR